MPIPRARPETESPENSSLQSFRVAHPEMARRRRELTSGANVHSATIECGRRVDLSIKFGDRRWLK